MFLSVCGLMATGARTLLISRWRTGGQSSLDLVREFAQELPQSSPADAWQRAVLLEMDSRANLEGEPRIKRGVADEMPKASHPFFWAGYMLVDCTPPPKPEPIRDEPVLKPKKR
jgi:CHAT domain-containing protein